MSGTTSYSKRRSTRARKLRPAATAKTYHPTNPAPCGRLVIVVSPDPCQLDFFLTAVRRRTAAPDRTLFFPHRISTKRRCPPPGDVYVSHRVFDSMEAEGTFLFSWLDDLGRHAVPIEVHSALEGGATVIVGLPPAAEAEARMLWHDVKVVRLTGQTEPVRAPLSAQACMARLMSPIAPVRALAERIPRPDPAVRCDWLARAVTELSRLLEEPSGPLGHAGIAPRPMRHLPI